MPETLARIGGIFWDVFFQPNLIFAKTVFVENASVIPLTFLKYFGVLKSINEGSTGLTNP